MRDQNTARIDTPASGYRMPQKSHYFPVRDYHLAILQPGEMLQKIRLTLSHLESINDS
jgi:hypothetical protein